MQIKTIMRYHYTSIRVAKIKRMTIASVDEDLEYMKPSCIAGGNTKCCSCYGKQFGSSSKS